MIDRVWFLKRPDDVVIVNTLEIVDFVMLPLADYANVNWSTSHEEPGR